LVHLVRRKLFSSRYFFSPLCIEHLYETHPELIGALGIAPGFRFLVARHDVDIWYDEALLDA